MTAAPQNRLPVWIWTAFGVQAAISALFLAVGWSHTVSLARGRAASTMDIAILSLPLVLVLAFWFAAWKACRHGRRDLAKLCAFAPWPLAMVAYSLLGAV